MSYNDRYNAATQLAFQNRVLMAMTEAALGIATGALDPATLPMPAGVTVSPAQILAFTASILQSPDIWVRAIGIAVCGTTGIGEALDAAAEAGRADPTRPSPDQAIDDPTLQSAVNQIYVLLASQHQS